MREDTPFQVPKKLSSKEVDDRLVAELKRAMAIQTQQAQRPISMVPPGFLPPDRGTHTRPQIAHTSWMGPVTCLQCGAVIGDEELHRLWHQEMQALAVEQAIKTLHESIEQVNNL